MRLRRAALFFSIVPFACGAIALAAAVRPSAAQQADEPQLNWTSGPGTQDVGENLAEIDLSEQVVFLGADDTRTLMELFQNPVSGHEMATLAPAAGGDSPWFLIFEWEPIGWVDDSEKDDLDPGGMLDSIRSGTEAANAERQRRGWSTMSIIGWHEEPHYDSRTNNLTWAVIGESDGTQNVNRIVKLLGRRGVMTATLVTSPDTLLDDSIAVDDILQRYRFKSGSTYAEYVPGNDKLAEYGLTALVVGGGAAALLKSGLLARFWKVIVAGVVAVGAGLRRVFGRSSEKGPTLPS